MKRLAASACAFLAFVSSCVPVSCADWPFWRGPNRNGTTPERLGISPGAQARISLRWTADVKEGCGSVVVWKGRVYATGWADGKETVFCLSAADGKVVWTRSYPSPRYGRHAVGDQEWYSGPTATPLIDPETGFLYTLGCDGDLHCWDAEKSGALVWKTNLYDTFTCGRRPLTGGAQTDYGYTTSPLVHKEMLLVPVGGRAGLLRACDKRTGQWRWASEATDFTSNSGGISPIEVDGIPCVAVLALERLVVIRLDAGNEGKTLATFPWKTDYANNLVTPTVIGSRILLSSAYNQSRSVLLDIAPQGIVQRWQSRRFSGVCSPAVFEGRLYFAYLQVFCLDQRDGSLVWQGPRTGHDGSCLVTGDGFLIVSGGGDLVIGGPVGAQASSFTEVCRRKGISRPDEGWPHVVFADGRIYCKDRYGAIFCFVVEESAPRT